MKRFTPIVLLWILIFTTAVYANEEQKSSINFSEGYIIVEGIGVMPKNISDQAQGIAMARLAAKVDAQRNLLEIIAGLQLNSETSVINLMANDTVRTQVEGILRGARIVPGSEYFQQGIYRLELKVEIKNLAQILQSTTPEKVQDTTAPKFSGLAIDARGFTINAPEILEIRDTKGNLIYAANRNTNTQPIPIVKVKKSATLTDQRLGANPLNIIIKKTSSADGSVIVVSEEDGKLILSSLEGTDVFLLTKIIVFTGGSE